MADKATYSALQKKAVTIPAYSVATVDYIDSQPNYFRVQNSGKTVLYCSTVNMPTEIQHDFSVAPAGMKMFAEPFNRSKLYIFNPSGNLVYVSVLSFRAEFDPLTLALSDMSIDLDGVSLESSNVISGFETPLPSGGNEIGKVQVSGMTALPVGGNHIGSVDVDKLPALPSGSNKIGKVEVTNLNDYEAVLSNILTALGNISVSGGGASAGNYTLLAGSVETISEGSTIDFSTNNVVKINFLSNDGDRAVRVTLNQKNGNPVWFELKAGEVINDMDVPLNSLELKGTDIPVRYIVTGIV